jgi:hypothetical protein
MVRMAAGSDRTLRIARAIVPPLLILVAGCAFFRKLGGKDTVRLDKADVRSMSVDIRKQQKTICPREPVQMAVFANVVLDASEGVKGVETWQGRGQVSKNGKLDFADFAFSSSEGVFDQDGWFSPQPNLSATVGREFWITAVYRRRPDQFTFKTNYKPDYDCIRQTGKDGGPGHPGHAGAPGSSGSTGSAGFTTYSYSPPSKPGGYSSSQSRQGPGGPGGDGTRGSPGGPGGPGEPGPQLKVYVAMVKTPYYDKLVAARITGAVDDFLLFAPERALLVHANGGRGGAGGNGGAGGRGGPGGPGNPPGARGRDGAQGPGGHGGAGGPGGSIDLVFDGRFVQELEAAIDARALGGGGGPGGAGGGAFGSPGNPGRVTRNVADVREQFAPFAGVTLL